MALPLWSAMTQPDALSCQSMAASSRCYYNLRGCVTQNAASWWQALGHRAKGNIQDDSESSLTLADVEVPAE